jgi:hypothetical protein
MLVAMGALSKLKAFFGRSAPMFAPMNDPFIQLDRDTIATQMRLRERGEERGSANLPPSDLATLDAVESEIAVLVGQHYSRAQIDAANNIRTYDSRLSELALLSNLSSITIEARRAVSDFKAEVVNRLNRLSNSRDAIISSYGELREFRDENGLRRPAHEVPPAVATYGYVAVAWLFETLMNAVLLRLNDSMGYLGGVVAAAIVGAINVLAAAFVGRQLWPRKNLRKSNDRTLAWIGIVAWLIFVLVWNVLAAHYRDAKSAGLPNPEQQAIHLMGSSPDSIYSWGLLVAGIIFAVTAAMAGYRMNDPYPGYGHITQRHDARCEDYVDEVERASEELRDIRDEAIDAAASVREQLGQQLTELTQILAARDTFCRRYAEYGDQLAQMGNALLQEYRSANADVRKTAPPAHFNAAWTLLRSPFPPAASVPISSDAVNAAESSLAAAVADITEAFDAAIQRFEPLDALKQRLTHG